MKFSLENSQPAKIKSDALILGVYSGEPVKEVLNSLKGSFPSELVETICQHLEEENFKGRALQSVSIPCQGQLGARRVIFYGLGEDATTRTLRKAAASLHRKLLKQKEGTTYSFILRGQKIAAAPTGKKKKAVAKKGGSTDTSTKYSESELVSAFVEGWALGSFSFDKYKTRPETKGTKKPGKKNNSVDLKFGGLSLSTKEFNLSVKRGLSIGEGTNLARELVDEPAAYMTPTRLAAEAKRIAKQEGMTCTVLTEAQIKKAGMGALLGVAKGADEPPRFIVIKYNAPKAKKQIALVGKGITFDSGGLSLKTPVGMEKMKYDMSGAAAVIGTMQAVGRLKPKVSVMGIVAATENMPSGHAMHPGDVIQAMNGKTIEVNNTDAEGRLVLADALCYACEEKVDEIIDLATLTGAIVHALGRVAAGVMGTGDTLIKDLVEAAEEGGEKLWRLPLYEEFKPKLKSDIADLKNAGSRGEAGSCCAAMFLKEFVKDEIPWAHMDIAGVAWSDKEAGEISKGGTGFGVRTLSHYILSR